MPRIDEHETQINQATDNLRVKLKEIMELYPDLWLEDWVRILTHEANLYAYNLAVRSYKVRLQEGNFLRDDNEMGQGSEAQSPRP